MMHEFETTVNLDLKIKVKMSIDEDIEFILLTEKYDHKKDKWISVEIVADGSLHDAILACQTWDEWKEQCFESLQEADEERKISMMEDHVI